MVGSGREVLGRFRVEDFDHGDDVRKVRSGLSEPAD